MTQITDWLRKNRKLTAVILINVLFLSFFFYFSLRTGIFKDDYGYMYMFSREEKLVNERVDSIADVFRSQYEHYFIMNGRAVSHSMLQTVLMMGKTWFSILNTAFYFLLSFGMYQLVRKRNEHSPLLQMMMYLAPWALFAEFGKVFLVSYLSVNYLWTMAIIAVTLIPFKRLFDGEDIFALHPLAGVAVMLPTGVISGWLSENGSAAMLFVVSCMGLYYLIARKKIPAWCIAGFAGMCIGFLAMLLAPGYDVRSAEYNDYSYITQFMKISVYHVLPYFGYMLFTLTALACLLCLRMERDKIKQLRYIAVTAACALVLSLICSVMPDSVRSECKLLTIFAAAGVCVWLAVRCAKAGVMIADLAAPCTFMLTGLIATYAMVASPTFETRSELQFLIFFTIGAAYVIYQLVSELSSEFGTELPKPVLLAAASLYAVISLTAAVPAVNNAYDQFLARESYIEEQKALGNYDLTLPAYDIPENSHAGMHNMINNDPDYWINQATCWYYGINSVTYEQAEE